MRRVVPIASSQFIVLATGDRRWTDVDAVVREFEQLPSNTTLIHGYADGLDMIAKVVADLLGFQVIDCPAHWRHNYVRYREVYDRCPEACSEVCGRPAGAIRNHWMLDTYRPHLVIGFHHDLTQSRGTKEMLTYAKKRGTPFKHFTE